MNTISNLRTQREHGFTLIELLAVIVIIGVLAAIAVPIFSSQREHAADAATISDLRNTAQVYQDYLIDNPNTKLHRGSYIAEAQHNVALRVDKPGSTSFPGTSSTGKETLLPGFQIPPTSPGTRLVIKVKPLSTYGKTINTAPGADPTQWQSTPEEAERFCVMGANSAGNYNFDNGGNFSRALYFDSTVGKVITRSEIPVDGACKQYR